MAEYENRQNWDLDAWPEMYGKLKELQATIFLSGPGFETNMMVFTVASLTSGCRHCQAHGGHFLDRSGVDIAKIRALWSFETSDLFSDAERAALRFAVASATVPNSVDASHHADLRAHYTDDEVRALLGVSSIAAFMNRYNDSLATVTDEASIVWAGENLAEVGWEVGKHQGAAHEQRSGPPGG